MIFSFLIFTLTTFEVLCGFNLTKNDQSTIWQNGILTNAASINLSGTKAVPYVNIEEVGSNDLRMSFNCSTALCVKLL